MAKTVIGYFTTFPRALDFLHALEDAGIDPANVNIISKSPNKRTTGYDDTIEVVPIAEWRDAFFDAEMAEEDAGYYQATLEKGNVLVGVLVPTNPEESRQWEVEQANAIRDLMRKADAFDFEIRVHYTSNGTTYPQNRFYAPRAPSIMRADHNAVYLSTSPLQGERSNMLGGALLDARPTVDEGGRRIQTGLQALAAERLGGVIPPATPNIVRPTSNSSGVKRYVFKRSIRISTSIIS